MKRILLLLVLSILISNPAVAQFTSESFENWEGGVPVNWFTSNLLNIFLPITQSTDAMSGSFAVKGTVIPASGGAGRYAPIMAAGPFGKGFPIDFRPEALRGWYKFSSDSGDAFAVSFVVIKNRSAVGSGGYFSTEVSPAYKEFIAEVFYSSQQIPDTIQMTILVSGSPPHIGSTFILDDLSLGSATDVEEIKNPLTYELDQNYPNPFNPSTRIYFQIPEEQQVSIKVFDSIGREVSVLVNNQMTSGKYFAEFNAEGLSGGIYYYRLQAGEYTQTRKMLVLK